MTVQEVWVWGGSLSMQASVEAVLEMKVRTTDGGNCNVLIVTPANNSQAPDLRDMMIGCNEATD